MSSIFNNVAKYLPSTTVRSINKQYHTDDYCKRSSHVYNQDIIPFKNNDNTVIYYQDDEDIVAIMLKNQFTTYKTKQIDNYIQLTIHKHKYHVDYLNDNLINDIDLLSSKEILKSRGCEDIIENYSKINTLKSLVNIFRKYFNPDVITDIIYLYIYLHSNCVLLGYEEVKDETKQFKLNKIPKDEFIQKIYDMYNLLYVHNNI
jgi:hypothetical protein